jgi:PEP-CTERM motif
MKRKLFRPEFLALLLGGVAAHGQVVNFSDASNGQWNGYDLIYYGQGAYSDPGNNIWNGFGQYPGPGSTFFYGPSNPDNPNLSGNPGNPYGWSNAGPASGSNLFSPAHYAAANAGNATSAGALSSVTLTLSYASDNGWGNVGVDPDGNGSPSFLVGEAAIVSGSNLGTFTLNNVAAGTYDLFLYGANYDYTRGAAFTITEGGGTAAGGFTSALNGVHGGTKDSFTLGDDYVEFTGITVGADGTISGTWGDPGQNSVSGLSGEGDFNGLQLVAVPEPSTWAFLGLGIAGMLAARRRK